MLIYVKTVIYSILAAMAMYLHLENVHQAHIISTLGEAAFRIVRYQSNYKMSSQSKYVVAPVSIASNPIFVNCTIYIYIASWVNKS